MKPINKKGIGLSQVVPVGITLVVIAITLSVGADVLDSIMQGQCPAGSAYNQSIGGCQVGNQTGVVNTTTSYNATNHGLAGIDELGSWQDTWAVVLALAVIVGVLGFLTTRN